MASFNRIIIMGNLTKDPELKLAAGAQVCRITIASNRRFKNKQTGVMSQEVCFIDVDIWGAQAESSNQYLRKGSPVLIEGRLRYDSWKDAEGNSRHRHAITAERVVFIEGRSDTAEAATGIATDEAGMLASSSFEPVTTTEQLREKKGGSKKVKGEEPVFKDVSPFEEDLPF